MGSLSPSRFLDPRVSRKFEILIRITQAKSERSSPRQVGSGDTSPACSKRKKSRTELRQKTNGSRKRPLKTLKNGLFRGFSGLFDKICHYRPLYNVFGFFDKIFLSFSTLGFLSSRFGNRYSRRVFFPAFRASLQYCSTFSSGASKTFLAS